ncbi:MAG: SdrD B-like domain-containing protein [Clostridium sp.]
MKVTGRVVYDVNRSGTIEAGDTGISGAKVVLQDKQTLLGLTVITDGNGNYEFNNVPQGNYRLVEDNAQTDGTNTPADF